MTLGLSYLLKKLFRLPESFYLFMWVVSFTFTIIKMETEFLKDMNKQVYIPLAIKGKGR